jgi:hypothetical protein
VTICTEYQNSYFFFGFLCYIITVASLRTEHKLELKCGAVGTLVEGPTQTTASHFRDDKTNIGRAEIFMYPQTQALEILKTVVRLRTTVPVQARGFTRTWILG